jgi:hypothetical protein
MVGKPHKDAGLPGEENLRMTKSNTLSAEGRSSGPDCKHFWMKFQSEFTILGCPSGH